MRMVLEKYTPKKNRNTFCSMKTKRAIVSGLLHHRCCHCNRKLIFHNKNSSKGRSSCGWWWKHCCNCWITETSIFTSFLFAFIASVGAAALIKKHWLHFRMATCRAIDYTGCLKRLYLGTCSVFIFSFNHNFVVRWSFLLLIDLVCSIIWFPIFVLCFTVHTMHVWTLNGHVGVCASWPVIIIRFTVFYSLFYCIAAS